MHDFLLAKEIVDKILELIEEKNIGNIKAINLEVGQVALAHDGFLEHTDDIDLENLLFGLETATKDTALEDVEFNISEGEGESWKIKSIETE